MFPRGSVGDRDLRSVGKLLASHWAQSSIACSSPDTAAVSLTPSLSQRRCALDGMILAYVGHFPPATIGGTVSVDLRSRDLKTPERRHRRRGAISIDAHREKR